MSSRSHFAMISPHYSPYTTLAPNATLHHQIPDAPMPTPLFARFRIGAARIPTDSHSHSQSRFHSHSRGLLFNIVFRPGGEVASTAQGKCGKRRKRGWRDVAGMRDSEWMLTCSIQRLRAGACVTLSRRIKRTDDDDEVQNILLKYVTIPALRRYRPHLHPLASFSRLLSAFPLPLTPPSSTQRAQHLGPRQIPKRLPIPIQRPWPFSCHD